MKKLIVIAWSVSIILILYLALGNFSGPGEAATYGYGSRGTVVRQIQTRLKNWGYYNGAVDGVYGYGTYSAVKYFQRKNGLYPDGVAGAKTLGALGINAPAAATPSTAGSQNVTLLARLINGEARGEPFVGQVAVGGVIMNRLRDPRFPNTIPGIIYQPGAFSAVTDGQMWGSQLLSASVTAARDAINGWDPSGGAIFYYNPAKTTNKWIWSRPIIKVIGSHVFTR